MIGLVSIGSDGSVTKLPDFTALSTQIAQITPSGINAASYTPTNTQAQSCPSGPAWSAATNLPPSPNAQLCSCMVKTLSCVANPNLSANSTGPLFAVACGLVNGVCDGIVRNGTTGVYGAYSMCNPTEQLSWVYNQYYLSQKSASSACSFSGNAQTQQPQGVSGDCKNLLSQAGSAGTGTVTSAPTGTGAGTSTSKKSAAGAVTVPRFDTGLLQLGAYLVGAALTGAGMVLL